MPRRNLFILVAVSVVSLMCYQKVQTNPYGRVLAEAMQQIQDHHLELIEPEELFEGAMEGMISKLDENSTFFSPTLHEEFLQSIDPEFGGVGMQVTVDDTTQQLRVAMPLYRAPAYKAGIRAGDQILKIDSLSTQGLSMSDAVHYMRGERGEPVTLTILHEGDTEPTDITIIRDVIQVETVYGDTRRPDGSWNFFLEGHDRIGYVRIITFAKNTANELRASVQDLLDRGMEGLIIDLRDDPGGLLPETVEICDMFVDSGIIVTTRQRDGVIRDPYSATKKGTFPDFPIAVLVNQYSASASEILAACLQDHGKAVIVGQRSFGKGTVQEVIPLGAGQAHLKLTTASFWRPSGKNIHRSRDAKDEDGWGVTPDKGYEVVIDNDELNAWRRWRFARDVNTDADGGPAGQASGGRQLAKAIEYIEKEIGGR